MKYIQILVLGLASLVSQLATAQAVGTPYLPDSYIPFSFLYGGDGMEAMRNNIGNMQQTSDGGYIIAGGTKSSSASGDISGTSRGDSDAWILKVDALGKKQWEKRYGGSFEDYAVSVKQTAEGGYIVACTTRSQNSGEVGANHGSNRMDYWILKLDALGAIQWNKIYGGIYDEIAYDVVQTTDGGYIIVGNASSLGGGDITPIPPRGGVDIWVLKLDTSGNKLWDKLYGGDLHEELAKITKTSDGGYIITSYTSSSASGDVSGTNNGTSDFWIIKLDASGNKMWDKIYGGSGQDHPYSIRQTSDGGYIVVGVATSGFSGDISGPKGGWVIKLNASGNMQWNKVVESQTNAYDAQQTPDNGYLILGTDYSYIANTFVVKLDTAGNQLWEKSYATSVGSSNGVSLQLTIDGNYVIGGYRSSQAGVDTSNGASDFWIMKIDPSGETIRVPDVGQ